MDNGGATNVSQTWTASDLQSVTWNFNNGGLVTTFSSPFDGGFNKTDGHFVTDVSGNLTGVMIDWNNGYSLATSDFSSTGSGDNIAWFLNGLNGVYFENSWNEEVDITNVSSMLSAANWSQVTSAPVPSALWLFGSGLLGLAGMARRKT